MVVLVRQEVGLPTVRERQRALAAAPHFFPDHGK